MKPTPTVGQILYSLNVGNAARNREQVLTPVKVVKVGRKYFTTQHTDDTSGWSATDYYIEDWSQKSEYIASSCLYVSEESWETEKHQRELIKQIEDFVSCRMLRELSVEVLQSVVSILNKV